ncbi:CEP164 [Symbiodinium necroappetens]|uniref:CEP164 protein n=1 Tax=Symbiodinium necroappetens TaxID=1628268 RepID=A0A813A116_9DINO|nr:CEP164 [Symbiodinium necroappetens]
MAGADSAILSPHLPRSVLTEAVNAFVDAVEAGFTCRERDFKAALRDSVVILELSPGDAAEEAMVLNCKRATCSPSFMGPSPKGKSSLHEYLDPLTFCTSDPSTPLPIFCKNSVQMALTAAAELGADADELLEVIRRGGILDRCSPLSLRVVEQWVEDVAKVAEARTNLRHRQSEGAVDNAPQQEAEQALAPSGERSIKSLSGSEVTDVYHRGFVAWAGFPRAEEMREPLFFHEWALWLGNQLSILNWRLLARRKGVQLEDSTAMSPRSQQRAAVEALVAAFESAGRPAVEAPEALGRPVLCDAEAVLQQVSRVVPGLRSR